MRVRLVLAAALSAGLTLAGTTLLGGSASGALVPTATTSTLNDVRVGSFNISNVTYDPKATGDHRVWKDRRATVASQILSQKLDVVGVQEANQSYTYSANMVSGGNQFLDLRDGLNAKGGNYELTNTNSYNCVKSTSTYKCVYADQGASGDNRIYYDTDTVRLVRSGSYQYAAQTAGKNLRFMTWGVFEMKATGKQFLFTDTHLDPYTISVRIDQFKELVAQVKALKGTLPVVAVGDYNTSKWSDYAGTVLPMMKNNGFGDVLNQVYRENPIRSPRAEATRRLWVNSFNGWVRDGHQLGYADARTKAGNNIDWIFATNSLRVKAWEVVVNMDATTLQLKGVIPSDHNLVRATLSLG